MLEPDVIKSRPLTRSLRFRVAVGVALPLFLLLIVLSLMHYFRARKLLKDQLLFSAAQVGQITLGSLRHTMMEQDLDHMRSTLKDVSGMENITQVVIVDDRGVAAVGDNDAIIGTTLSTTDPGCIECHQEPPELRQQAAILQRSSSTLRIAAPVSNEPECRTCHPNTVGHLGVLLIDMSMVDAQTRLIKDLQLDLVVSAGFTLLVTLVLYQLVNFLVVRRIERFRMPLMAISEGRFDVAIPQVKRANDEIDVLANSINNLSAELRDQQRHQESRQRTRHKAIVEERERIAREMHDGVAQLMGYVSNKTSAIRLLLEKGAKDEAVQQLEELAGASHDSFIEVRAAILGLRTSDQNGEGLSSTLETFVAKFSDMSGINVDLNLPPETQGISLDPESELHLLRITQEALSNVQKHAESSNAWVSLRLIDHTLELMIGDDGYGFDINQAPKDNQPRFGLSTMRERAEAMQATFDIESKLNSGTLITVSIPVEDG